MSSWSRRVSVGRLLLCAAFIAFGFVLASWTSAQADDKGLLGTVVETAPTVGEVLETTTTAVSSTTAAVPVTVVDEVVAKPVEAVSKVIEKPADTADLATAVVAESAAKALSHSTSRVVTAVRTVAPTASPVLDPVVAVIAPVTGPVKPAPGAGLPGAVVEVVGSLAPGPARTASRSDAVASQPGDGGAVAAALGRGVTTTSEPADFPAADGASISLRLVVAPTATAALRVTSARAAGGTPPTPMAPGPASALTGLASGPASTGSPVSAGGDAATTPTLLDLPGTASASAHSRLFSITRGPVLDPGSRPG